MTDTQLFTGTIEHNSVGDSPCQSVGVWSAVPTVKSVDAGCRSLIERC